MQSMKDSLLSKSNHYVLSLKFFPRFLTAAGAKNFSKSNFLLISRHFHITYTPGLTSENLLRIPTAILLAISPSRPVCGGAIKAEQNYNSQLAKHLHQPTNQQMQRVEVNFRRWQASAFFACKKNDSWKRPETPAGLVAQLRLQAGFGM